MTTGSRECPGAVSGALDRVPLAQPTASIVAKTAHAAPIANVAERIVS
jgi:hypothetical protein